jgi:hypothetical protein
MMTLRDRAELLFNLIELHSIRLSEIVALNIYTHSHSLQITGGEMLRLIQNAYLTSCSLYHDGNMHVLLMLNGVEVVCCTETEEQNKAVVHKQTQQNLGKQA